MCKSIYYSALTLESNNTLCQKDYFNIIATFIQGIKRLYFLRSINFGLKEMLHEK